MKKILISIAFTASAFFITGCDNSDKQTPEQVIAEAQHDKIVHENYEKLKSDVSGRFVPYNGDYNSYVMDIKTKCEYVNFTADPRAGYNLIAGSCKE